MSLQYFLPFRICSTFLTGRTVYAVFWRTSVYSFSLFICSGMPQNVSFWTYKLIFDGIICIVPRTKLVFLVMMIGIVEVLKVGQQIIEANRTASPNAAFGVFLVIFLLYFAACWPISILSRFLEKKWKV